MIPLLLLLVGLFMPKPPEWNPFQEPKISPAQERFADAVALLFPAVYVAELLALVVADSGSDAGGTLPATIVIIVSILLNGAIYLGIGLILWFFGEVFSSFFQKRSSN